MKKTLKTTIIALSLFFTTNLSAGQIIANINCPLSKIVLKGEKVELIKLKQIFEGKVEKCTDGNKIFRFSLPETDPIMGQFAEKIFNIGSTQLFHKWGSLELSQGIAKPKIISTTDRMIRSISNNNNSVGIVADNVELPPNIIKILDF